VQVHLRTAAPSVSTRLLDMQPWSASAFRSPALAPYAVWPVPGAGLSVRVTRVTATGARVEIVPTGQDAVRPSAPALLSPSTGAHLAGAVRVRWSGARDSGSGVAAYTVLLNGVPVARTAPSARSAVLRSVPDGTHRLQVQAVDAAGNASPARAAQRFRVTGAR
jgi:hypothetical protein